jgi:UDP-N-acetylglucosamine--N-acetylmuramyl-(pentapeptide) pyrophosphoryl-undecaprenol N-acetylglucosamine transferase
MPKVLIAAGGTGGHIYPALAIADALKAASAQTQIEFVGTAHGLENTIVPAKGYRVQHLPIGRLNSNVSLRERVQTVFLLPWALLKSVWLLRQENPDFVLGVGGHASGPLLLMAALLGYRTAIWEPNAMPGMANRWLSRFVDECWVVFEEARTRLHSKNLHVGGMPVRREIEEMPVSTTAGTPFRLLVFGGSQGARGLNNAVVEMVKSGRLNGVQIVHQTGAFDYKRVREAYGEALAQVDLREYLHDMGQQYAKADLVVCRSGTGTLSELAACGKAAILVPLPTAADDHQRLNAESLVEKGAAVMILQKDLNGERLRQEIEALRAHPERLRGMSAAVRGFHHPRAAENLAGRFLERMSENAAR